MVDEPENIVLPALNRIREQNDTILRKLDEVITRLGAVERDIAGMEVAMRRPSCGWITWIGGSSGSSGASSSPKRDLDQTGKTSGHRNGRSEGPG